MGIRGGFCGGLIRFMVKNKSVLDREWKNKGLVVVSVLVIALLYFLILKLLADAERNRVVAKFVGKVRLDSMAEGAFLLDGIKVIVYDAYGVTYDFNGRKGRLWDWPNTMNLNYYTYEEAIAHTLIGKVFISKDDETIQIESESLPVFVCNKHYCAHVLGYRGVAIYDIGVPQKLVEYPKVEAEWAFPILGKYEGLFVGKRKYLSESMTYSLHRNRGTQEIMSAVGDPLGAKQVNHLLYLATTDFLYEIDLNKKQLNSSTPINGATEGKFAFSEDGSFFSYADRADRIFGYRLATMERFPIHAASEKKVWTVHFLGSDSTLTIVRATVYSAEVFQIEIK